MPRDVLVTDLIPRKGSAFALWFLAGVTLIAGLEALYLWMPDLARFASDGRVAAFDLDGEGSLAVWFSSATLALASLTALLVYSIRRHKPDDYHGRYRIWLWAAICWLLMSVDECGSLHEGFKELMAWLTHRRGFGDGSIWWVGAYLLVLSGVGLRLMLEMRPCRGSTAALVATAVCYGVAVVAQLGLVLPESGARGVMLEEGCEMLGNLCLLLSMALHARYATLEARGELPVRAMKVVADDDAPERPAKEPSKSPAKVQDQAAVAPSRRWWWRRTKVETSHVVPAPHSRRSDLKPVETSSTPAIKRRPVDGEGSAESQPREAGGDQGQGERHLSRAERKALRRARRPSDDE